MIINGHREINYQDNFVSEALDGESLELRTHVDDVFHLVQEGDKNCNNYNLTHIIDEALITIIQGHSINT